jgi:general secretion pathway protein B
MSSILKALKKVENDKKVCKPEQLGIDARILQERSSARLSRSTLILFATALFVCGGGATYLYMKHNAEGLNKPQSQSSRTESISPSSYSVNIPPAIKDSTPHITPPTPNETQLSSNPIKISRPVQPQRQVEIAPAPESKSASVPTVPAVSSSRPTLTVNGIAFQEGSNDNMAIINGVAMANGAVIEGVKIEDIQKDRVRFSQHGEQFEILLNKSNK